MGTELYLTVLCQDEHVVRVVDGYHSPWHMVLVMELAESNLHRWAMRYPAGILPPSLLGHLAWQVAKGLAHVHGKCVVHRDLHAGNVLVHEDVVGGSLQFRIADFGCAAILPVAHRTQKLTAYRIARTSRPPELLFCPGAKYNSSGDFCGPRTCHYGFPADVWGLGILVLGSSYGAPPFYARTSHDVAQCIVAALGPVPLSIVTKFSWKIPLSGDIGVKRWWPAPTLDEIIAKSSMDDRMDLRLMVCHMLRFDPDTRWSASACAKSISLASFGGQQ